MGNRVSRKIDRLGLELIYNDTSVKGEKYPEFEKEVRKAMEEIKKTFFGRLICECLENCDEPIVIRYTEDMKNAASPAKPLSVEYSPDSTFGYRGDNTSWQREPWWGLAHELVHIYDGLHKRAFDKNGYPRKDFERRARFFTNLMILEYYNCDFSKIRIEHKEVDQKIESSNELQIDQIPPLPDPAEN